MKKLWKPIVLTVAILVSAILLFIKFYDPYRITLTPADKNEIIETVNGYYNSLEKQNYSKALSYCEIDNDHNEIHLDITTRLQCLQELRKNVITSFQYNSMLTNGSDGSVLMIYEKNQRAFYVSAICELSYAGIEGAAMQENVYLRKIGDTWKIVHLMSSDRYVGYRVGSYTYLQNFRFLNVQE